MLGSSKRSGPREGSALEAYGIVSLAIFSLALTAATPADAQSERRPTRLAAMRGAGAMGRPVHLAKTPLAALPHARQASASASHGVDMFVAGGVDAEGAMSGRVDVLDLQTGTWRSLSDKVLPRRDHGAAVVGGVLVLVGGRTESGPTALVELVDLDTGEIRRAAPLPTPRAHAGVAAHRGRVFVAGGTLGWGRLDAVEVYDVEADTWYRGPKLSQARDARLVSVDGQLFALGGLVKTGIVSARVERLADDERTWVRRGDMPAPTSSFALCALEGRILTFGDWADPGRVFVYDPLSDRWSWARGGFTARRRAAAAALGGRAVVVGGAQIESGADAVTDLVEAFQLR